MSIMWTILHVESAQRPASHASANPNVTHQSWTLNIGWLWICSTLLCTGGSATLLEYLSVGNIIDVTFILLRKIHIIMLNWLGACSSCSRLSGWFLWWQYLQISTKSFDPNFALVTAGVPWKQHFHSPQLTLSQFCEEAGICPLHPMLIMLNCINSVDNWLMIPYQYRRVPSERLPHTLIPWLKACLLSIEFDHFSSMGSDMPWGAVSL
jgi:hypothetical protein